MCLFSWIHVDPYLQLRRLDRDMILCGEFSLLSNHKHLMNCIVPPDRCKQRHHEVYHIFAVLLDLLASLMGTGGGAAGLKPRMCYHLPVHTNCSVAGSIMIPSWCTSFPVKNVRSNVTISIKSSKYYYYI